MNINLAYALGIQERIGDFQINLLESGIQVLDISKSVCDITSLVFLTNERILITEDNLNFARNWCNSHDHNTVFQGFINQFKTT